MADSLVLCYHAVSRDWAHPMGVRPEALRQQVRSLLGRGWRPATFTHALTRPDSRQFVVTFDDGFLSTYELALPVLAELGVPATVFVPSALLTAGAPLRWEGFDPSPLCSPDELRPMSWEQVGELVDRGWEVGSHSSTHPRLSRLGDDALRDELHQSRLECVERTGQPCRAVAYPFGDLDDRVLRAARDAGYTWGAALGPHPSRPGPLTVPRTGVYRDDDGRRFALKTSRALRSRAGTAVLARVKQATSVRRTGAGC